MDVTKGLSIALAVSSLLAVTGCGGSDDEGTDKQSERIMCEGGNSCAGHSECAAADGSSSCAGTNSCAGKGWIYTDTQEECEAAQAANKA